MKRIAVVLPNASKNGHAKVSVEIDVYSIGCENETAVAEQIRATLQKMLDDKFAKSGDATLEDTELERCLKGLGSYGEGFDNQPWVVTVDCAKKSITVQGKNLSLAGGSEPQGDIKAIFDEVASRVFR